MHFEDSYFDVISALGNKLEAKYYPNIVWLRACSLPGASLFGVKISPEDVIEGELDDCYLVGALTLLAQHPSMVRSLFNSKKSNEADGRHCVCIWQQGQRLEVEVDDRIPCHLSSRRPVFAHCRNAAGFWVQIVEKAFAKLHGSYESLAGGSTAEALHDLTGRPVFDYNLEAPDIRADIRDGHLWCELCQHLQSKSMVACSFFRSGNESNTDAVSRQGLIPNHAYCVLEACEFPAKYSGSDTEAQHAACRPPPIAAPGLQQSIGSSENKHSAGNARCSIFKLYWYK